MTIRYTQEQIKEYRDNPAVNQSTLKAIIGAGMQAFLAEPEKAKLYYEEKEHFIIGDMVDMHLSLGKEAVDKNFYAAALPEKLSDKQMSIVKMVFDHLITTLVPFSAAQELSELSEYKEQLWEACNSEEYYMNRKKDDWKIDKRMDDILKDGWAQIYWNELIKSNGKQLVSLEEAKIYGDIIKGFEDNHVISEYLKERTGVDFIYQLPIYWDFEGVACKGLLDLLIIDHNKKLVTPVDFKTMADYVLQFPVAMRRRRYDIQGSFYSFGLLKAFDDGSIAKILGKDLGGYQCMGMRFIVASKCDPATPAIFGLAQDIVKDAFLGTDKLIGWRDAIMHYKDWMKCEFSVEKFFELHNYTFGVSENFTIGYIKNGKNDNTD